MELGDEALIAAARNGDREAFGELAGRHLPLLLAVCRRMLRDQWLAEDAAQEAVLRAMVSLDRLRDESRFGPWLIGIGLNTCRRLARRRQRAELLAGSLLGGIRVLDTASGPEIEAQHDEIAAIVREAIAALPDGQRRAVQAFYLAGLSYEESASELGINVGSVKTRLHKARRRLKGQLLDVWKEDRAMATNGKQPVDVQVKDVRRREQGPDTDYHVVILKETGGDRHLPIWVGPFEGTAIAIHLQKTDTPRPLTFTLMADLLRESGAQLKEVRIRKLVGDTFFATVDFGARQGARSVDARPSDAIALALVEGAPIRVDADVFVANEKQEKARLAEDKWHGDGTLGAAEIVAEVTARWRPRQEPASE
jgi:RNA polymerase sigma factor (sigma-70 family)